MWVCRLADVLLVTCYKSSLPANIGGMWLFIEGSLLSKAPHHRAADTATRSSHVYFKSQVICRLATPNHACRQLHNPPHEGT